jgi:hypothetical protein
VPWPGSVLCGAKTKLGTVCKSPAIKGTTLCRKHGGLTQLQKQPGIGIYSNNQPSFLKDLTEEHLASPHLLDLKQQIAVVSAILAHSFERLKLENKEQLDTNDIITLTSLSEKIAQMIERCAKIGVAVRMLVHMETVEELLAQWVDIAKQFIPKERHTDFAKLLNVRAAEIVLEESKEVFQVPGKPIQQLQVLRKQMKVPNAQQRQSKKRVRKSYGRQRTTYSKALKN